MPSLTRQIRTRDFTLQEKNFKSSMHDLSSAVVNILVLLGQPSGKIATFTLGSRLALLLTSLRSHRKFAVDLGSLVNNTSQLDSYLDGLHNLRATVAHWLTIHAVNPRLIFVEIADFEAQSWSTLSLGMVLLDDSEYQDFSLNSALPSRFHQWWNNMHLRPDAFAA